MHRTKTVPPVKFWGVLLSVVLAGVWAAGAGAQEKTPVITLPVGGTYRLQSPFLDKDKHPTAIKTVVNENDNVLEVRPLADTSSAVLLVGKARGTSRITLTDVDAKRAVYDVIVEIDIQLLKRTIRQVAPTSNVEPVLAGGNASVVILTGWVQRPEDIDIIMHTAQTLLGVLVAVPVAPPPGQPAGGAGIQVVQAPPPVAGPQVINAMRVAGVMQVQLDVVVASVARAELRRMSFDFMNFGVHHVFASTPGGGFIVPSSGIAGTFPGAATITNTIGTPNGANSNFFLALFNNEQDFFGLLQLLRQEQLAKVLSEPKLITTSGRAATLLSGGQQAIPQPGGLGTVSVTFQPFGTQLSFLPVVMGNGKIHLEVEPSISVLDQANGTVIQGTAVPGRDVQSVHTVVEMEDGQTFAIGGLIQKLISGTTVKVPVLGDLPFLGAAFSSKEYNEQESELLILVTPHLIDPMSCDQLPKLLPGQETRSPDDFELFLEGILEAPRGPRQVCHDGRYVPAYKNGPTATMFPCAGDDAGSRCGCGKRGCGGTATTNGAGMSFSLAEEPALRGTSTAPGNGAGDTSPPSGAAAAESKPAALPPVLLPPSGSEGQN